MVAVGGSRYTIHGKMMCVHFTSISPDFDMSSEIRPENEIAMANFPHIEGDLIDSVPQPEVSLARVILGATVQVKAITGLMYTNVM